MMHRVSLTGVSFKFRDGRRNLWIALSANWPPVGLLALADGAKLQFNQPPIAEAHSGAELEDKIEPFINPVGMLQGFGRKVLKELAARAGAQNAANAGRLSRHWAARKAWVSC